MYVFLPICLGVYYAFPAISWRNGVLIVFSLLFYAWGEPVWTMLLIFSAAADYVHGRIIQAHQGAWQARAALVSSITVNIGLLALFKYSGLVVQSISAAFDLQWHIPQFELPLGISFYTFQTISYTIDVYRGRVEAQRSFWSFLLFVSLFHQLVAGPIVRYRDMNDQIEKRSFNIRWFSSGITRFALGLGKKVLIANACGAAASPFLDADLALQSTPGVWWGILLFAFQIYFDFGGYSDMAIGLGRMFGFHYRENFRYPYISRSAGEFWRRWHISLGSFFRDYLYIPLGGNRRHYLRNMLVVWALTGLWHGAEWNFLLWGLYYAVLIAAERGLALLRDKREAGILCRISRSRIFTPFRFLYACLITLVGWGVFYFTDISRLGQFFSLMFSSRFPASAMVELRYSVAQHWPLVVLAALASTPLPKHLWRRLARPRSRGSAAVRLLFQGSDIVLLAICTLALLASSYNPFLYFRF